MQNLIALRLGDERTRVFISHRCLPRARCKRATMQPQRRRAFPRGLRQVLPSVSPLSAYHR